MSSDIRNFFPQKRSLESTREEKQSTKRKSNNREDIIVQNDPMDSDHSNEDITFPTSGRIYRQNSVINNEDKSEDEDQTGPEDNSDSESNEDQSSHGEDSNDDDNVRTYGQSDDESEDNVTSQLINSLPARETHGFSGIAVSYTHLTLPTKRIV